MEKEQKQELGWRVSVLPIPAFHCTLCTCNSPGALIFSPASEIGDVAAFGSLQAILVNKSAGCLTSNLTATASPPVVNGTEIYCMDFQLNREQNWTILIAGDIDLDQVVVYFLIARSHVFRGVGSIL